MTTSAPAAQDFAPVTAVIPCFRNADTLHRAVQSVLDQTARPAEVIIVDDASDDESTRRSLISIEVAFAGSVRVIRLDINGGASVARNRGWDEASQPFVAFLDADDAWHPEKIALQLPIMLGRDGASISGHPISINEFIDVKECPPRFRLPVSLSLREMLMRNRFPTPSVILRTSLTQRFDPSRRLCEDYDLWLRIIAAGEKCRYLPIPLTSTFKASFGEKGLSNQLWAMDRAQADVYKSLSAEGIISSASYALLVLWGWIRFARRLSISGAQRLARSFREAS